MGSLRGRAAGGNEISGRRLRAHFGAMRQTLPEAAAASAD
jgi:hypothetical protein